MNGDRRSPLVYLVYILPIVVIAGIVGAGAATLLGVALDAVENLAQLLPRARFLLPCIGALIVGSLILRFEPGAGGEGVPLYIAAVNRGAGKSELSEALLKIPATIITLGTYGSGGVIGPLIRIGSGISGFLADRLLMRSAPWREAGRRTATICGASAAIAAVLHTPLAAGIFAAEVLRREDLRYADLFPSILAGIAGTLSSIYVFHREALLTINAPPVEMAAGFLPWLALAAVVAGMIGMLFLTTFEAITRALAKIPGRQPARVLAGSIAIAAIYYLMGNSALGASIPLLRDILTGNLALTVAGFTFGSASLAIAILITVKIAATSISVGSGMSGGFTAPLIILGIASGALIGRAAGTSPGDPLYFALLACALPSILGAVMNVPLAAAALSIGLFGPTYGIPAAIGGILSFFLFRTRSIYGDTDFSHLAGTGS